jgi:transcriptional regulator with XRE-family HTH domain
LNRRKRFPKGTWMRLTSADTLKALMGQRDFSEARLARYAGCSPSFISHLKTGRKRTCTPRLAEAIAEALDVPTELLFVQRVSPVSSRNSNGRAA